MTVETASPRGHVQAWRAAWQEQRKARAARRDLERQLATYSTPAEVDELLSLIKNEETAEAEQIREILTSNLSRAA